MSQLAKKLPKVETLGDRVRKGPTGACDIYGPGDMDDCLAVYRRRHRPATATTPKGSWADAQRAVDALLGITSPIDADKFRYHWNRRCWHWTQDQRNVPLEVGK